MLGLATSDNIRTILCATNFSAASDEAVRVACSLAADHAAKLFVVHVASPAVPGMGMTDSLVLHDDYLGAIEARLRALQCRGPRVQMEFRIEEGHPSTEIVKLARATRADLIVIGSRGGHAPPLPPSTAQEVLLRAPCAVARVTTKQTNHTEDHPPEGAGHERAIDSPEPYEIL
jgi:nucleotide-binding universal stress UspA family protein